MVQTIACYDNNCVFDTTTTPYSNHKETNMYITSNNRGAMPFTSFDRAQIRKLSPDWWGSGFRSNEMESLAAHIWDIGTDKFRLDPNMRNLEQLIRMAMGPDLTLVLPMAIDDGQIHSRNPLHITCAWFWLTDNFMQKAFRSRLNALRIEPIQVPFGHWVPCQCGGGVSIDVHEYDTKVVCPTCGKTVELVAHRVDLKLGKPFAGGSLNSQQATLMGLKRMLGNMR